MRKNVKIAAYVAGLLIAVISGVEFTDTLWSTGITGRVIDAKTAQPIPGAMVLAKWQSKTWEGSIAGDGGSFTCNRLAQALSTTTDENGEFRLPAWGPRWIPCRDKTDMMGDEQPVIFVYAPGHVIRKLLNSDWGPGQPLIPGNSRWDGRVIDLQPLEADRLTYAPDVNKMYVLRDTSVLWKYPANMDPKQILENYIDSGKNLIALSYILDDTFSQIHPIKCYWEQARPAMLMLMKEERRLTGLIPPHTELFDQWLPQSQNMSYEFNRTTNWSCGDQSAYLASVRAEASRADKSIYMVRAGMPDPIPLPPDDDTRLQDPASRTLGQQGIIYHVNLDPRDPYNAQVFAIYPLHYPDAPHGYDLDDSELRARTQELSGYYCPKLLDKSVADTNDGAELLNGCVWKSLLRPPERPVNNISPGIYSPGKSYIPEPGQFDDETNTWLLSQTMLKRVPTSLPEYVELDSKSSLVITTTLTPAGKNRWALPQPDQPFTLNVSIAGTAPVQDDPCERMIPDELRQELRARYSFYRVAWVTDKHPDADPATMAGTKCDTVVIGPFGETAETGYGIVFVGRQYKQPLLVAAFPKDGAWEISVPQAFCKDIKLCTLRLVEPGSYTISANSPFKPIQLPNHPGPPIYFTGEAGSLTAQHYGFAESVGSNVRFAYFYQNGHWTYVVVDETAQTVQGH